MINSLQNKAYKQILEDILKLKYVPAQRITEKELLASLNIGRTPVREAILRLRNEGLLDVIPQSGTYVSKIDLHAALTARFVRQNLEKAVVRECAVLASARDVLWLKQALSHQQEAANLHDSNLFFELDDDFHKKFYLITDKAIAWKWLQSMNVQLARFRRLRVMKTTLPWRLLIQQHTNIAEAIAAHDEDRAEHLVDEHLNLMLNEQKVLLDEFPDYFIH
ncbi:GntR family transcriptional regulator [Sporolactobacillus shoreicorticis]|uniref:GntR family transcriptional regulator n=1 Tax=Sporolactobacillus shoreicorticis TaxID=1923877 RepID=A0ABW5S958_9BACL|nr:GntR family transcriptional regulator [Sporolactobacillus shoreicorticis]MCO7127890.1 GntR family transcriptional regulator [Sporolactobacillus shoreicorticis]